MCCLFLGGSVKVHHRSENRSEKIENGPVCPTVRVEPRWCVACHQPSRLEQIDAFGRNTNFPLGGGATTKATHNNFEGKVGGLNTAVAPLTLAVGPTGPFPIRPGHSRVDSLAQPRPGW